MKKFTLIFSVLFLTMYIGFAQAPLLDGEKQVNLGVGLSSHGLPIYGGLEFGIGHNKYFSAMYMGC